MKATGRWDWLLFALGWAFALCLLAFLSQACTRYADMYAGMYVLGIIARTTSRYTVVQFAHISSAQGTSQHPSPFSCVSRRKSCGTTNGLRMKHSQKDNFWSSHWRIWSTSWRPRVTSRMTAAGSSSRWRWVGTGARLWRARLGHQGNASYAGNLGLLLFLAWCFKIFSCGGKVVYCVVVCQSRKEWRVWFSLMSSLLWRRYKLIPKELNWWRCVPSAMFPL